jgi:hypothetical protein
VKNPCISMFFISFIIFPNPFMLLKPILTTPSSFVSILSTPPTQTVRSWLCPASATKAGLPYVVMVDAAHPPLDEQPKGRGVSCGIVEVVVGVVVDGDIVVVVGLVCHCPLSVQL